MTPIGICQGILRTEDGTIRFICQTHDTEGPRRATREEALLDLNEHQKAMFHREDNPLMSMVITPKDGENKDATPPNP